MGIIGDLTSGEILEQLSYANAETKIRNIVFMGMGEPLQNYENVKRAVLFMIDDQRYALSPRQVTVSTVGVLSNMRRLSDDIPYISLALSLHAPNQSIRLKIVPTASSAPIHRLMEAVDYHIQQFSINDKKKKIWHPRHTSTTPDGQEQAIVTSPKKDMDYHPDNMKTFSKRKLCRVMIEYILIQSVNDRVEHAHELGALLSSRRDFVLLNLIPYNPTTVAEDYAAPSADDVKTFSLICQSHPYMIHTRIRQEMGQDIDGACGQLALSDKVVDIEDLSMNLAKKPSLEMTQPSGTNNREYMKIIMANMLLPLVAVCSYYRRHGDGGYRF